MFGTSQSSVITKLRQAWEQQDHSALALYVPLRVGLSAEDKSDSNIADEKEGKLGKDEKSAPAAAASSPIVKQPAAVNPLAQQVLQDFLNSQNTCLLLLGDSGAGKSLFGQWLTQQLWQTQNKTPYIPLFIPLAAQRRVDRDLIEYFLKTQFKLDDKEIAELKQQPLLLILDGYDEMPRKKHGTNLYQANNLQQWPKSKVLITCRNEMLINYSAMAIQDMFVPYAEKKIPCPEKLERWYVKHFEDSQIREYITTCLVSRKMTGSIENYQQHLQQIPGLKEFARTPFVLSMVIETLPTLLKKYEAKPKSEQLYLTRLELYDAFLQQWFARQKQKLLDSKRIKAIWHIEDDFAEYARRLAGLMWQQQTNVVEYKPTDNKDQKQTAGFSLGASLAPYNTVVNQQPLWAEFFDDKHYFNDDKEKPIAFVRAGCPLIQLGVNRYAFVHKSLLEYFACQRLFKSAQIKASITIGKELNDKLLNDEPSIIQFAADCVRSDKNFEETLWDIVYESQHEPRVAIAAANAITILNAARISFTDKDLRRIRICGANLSYGIFDGTNFQEADLREVNFTGAWLDNANFAYACMDGVQFGEKPYLQFPVNITTFCYSNNVQDSKQSKWLAVSSSTEIYIYEIAEHKLVHTIKHTGSIKCIAFSPDEKQLASGSVDRIVRLWEVATGKCQQVLKGHEGWISSVSFHPSGRQLASGSSDGTIKLWDLANGTCQFTLKGHESSLFGLLGGLITTISYRPDGQQLASGGNDGVVLLWEAATGKCQKVLKGRVKITSVSFHPNGLQLASGSSDRTVRLWDVSNSKLLYTLNEHTDKILNVVYRSDGKQLATASRDNTVRLWTLNTLNNSGICENIKYIDTIKSISYCPDANQLAVAQGNKIRLYTVINNKREQRLQFRYSTAVNSLNYHPDGQQLATSNTDNTISLWETASGKQLHALHGHIKSVLCVSFHPNGRQLASGSNDGTVKLWDLTSGTCQFTLKGHESSLFGLLGGCITTISYRPDGQQLASGSDDNTVRLWEVTTGNCQQVLKGHGRLITSISYSLNNEQIASSSKDKTVRLWDTKNGRCLVILRNFFGIATSVSWSTTKQGVFLATGGPIHGINHWQMIDEKKADKIRVKLLWSTNQNLLTLNNTVITQVTGVNDNNLLLLQQHGTVGKPSSKPSKEVLEIREKLRIVDPSKELPSVFSNNTNLHPTAQWVVTIARRRSGEAEQHAFLILESLEFEDEKATQSKNCYYRIRRADLFEERRVQADEKERASQGAVTGWVLIEVRDKDLRDIEPLVQQCVYRSWGISPRQGQQLLENIQRDQQQRIRYAFWQSGSSNNRSSHNCLTWCEGHLEKIGVNLDDQKSWLDWLVVHPSRHLPDDLVRLRNDVNRDAKENIEPPAEPNTKCLVM